MAGEAEVMTPAAVKMFRKDVLERRRCYKYRVDTHTWLRCQRWLRGGFNDRRNARNGVHSRLAKLFRHKRPLKFWSAVISWDPKTGKFNGEVFQNDRPIWIAVHGTWIVRVPYETSSAEIP